MRGKGIREGSGFALALVAGVLLAASVSAQQIPERRGFFDIRSATTTLNEGVHELEARLQLILSDEALDALNSGVPRRGHWPAMPSTAARST